MRYSPVWAVKKVKGKRAPTALQMLPPTEVTYPVIFSVGSCVFPKRSLPYPTLYPTLPPAPHPWNRSLTQQVENWKEEKKKKEERKSCTRHPISNPIVAYIRSQASRGLNHNTSRPSISMPVEKKKNRFQRQDISYTLQLIATSLLWPWQDFYHSLHLSYRPVFPPPILLSAETGLVEETSGGFFPTYTGRKSLHQSNAKSATNRLRM